MASLNIHDNSGAKNFRRRDFVPGNDDVIIGRGKKCYQHTGNERLRNMVAATLNEYSAASTKVEKSKILSSIVTQVRRSSPNGGFIKQDTSSGLWFEVGDFLAREKVSQAFRDALYKEYRSSNEFKKKRRRENSRTKSDLPLNKTSVNHLDQVQIDFENDESISMSDFDLEPSSDMMQAGDVVSTLSSTIPDSSFLAEWFEGANDELNDIEMMDSSSMDTNQESSDEKVEKFSMSAYYYNYQYYVKEGYVPNIEMKPAKSVPTRNSFTSKAA